MNQEHELKSRTRRKSSLLMLNRKWSEEYVVVDDLGR